MAVQCQPVEVEALAEDAVVLALAVAHVANNRMGGMLEVTPDLVGATSAGTRFEEAIALKLTQQTKVGDSRPLLRPLLLGEWMVHTAQFGVVAAAQSKIALGHATAGEDGLHVAGHLRAESKEQHATGRPVEAVNREHAPTDLITDLLQRRHAVGRPTAMGGHARWLVDSHQVRILVDHRELRRSQPGRHPLPVGLQHRRPVRAARPEGRLHHAREEPLELLLHMGRLEDAQGPGDRLERGEPLGLGLGANPPGTRRARGQGHTLCVLQTGDALGHPAGLSPVAVGDHQRDRPRVLVQQLAVQGPRILGGKEHKYAPSRVVERTQVQGRVADAMKVQLAVGKSRQCEGPGGRRLVQLTVVHDERQPGAGLEARDVLAQASRLVLTAPRAAHSAFGPLTHNRTRLGHRRVGVNRGARPAGPAGEQHIRYSLHHRTTMCYPYGTCSIGIWIWMCVAPSRSPFAQAPARHSR